MATLKTRKIIAWAIVTLALVATFATFANRAPAASRQPRGWAPSVANCQLPTADAGYAEDAGGDMYTGAFEIPCANGGYVDIVTAYTLADMGHFAAPCVQADSAVACAPMCARTWQGVYYAAPCFTSGAVRVTPLARGHNWTPAAHVGYYAQFYGINGALVGADYTSMLDV